MSMKAVGWAIQQKTGSPSAKVTLLAVAQYANKVGACFVKQSQIAEDTEQSVDSVQRRLAELEAAGFIVRFKRYRPTDGSRTTDLIVVIVDDAAAAFAHAMQGQTRIFAGTADCGLGPDGDAADCGSGPAADCGLGQTKAANCGDHAALVRQQEPSLEEDPSLRSGEKESVAGEPAGARAREEEPFVDLGGPIVAKPKPVKATTKSGDVDEAFGRFWAAYPRREGGNPKEPARLLFGKLVARGIDPEAIIAGAAAYAASRAGEEPRFTAMAKSWLNAGRWTDDYTPTPIVSATNTKNQTVPYHGASNARPSGPPADRSLIAAGQRLKERIRAAGGDGDAGRGGGFHDGSVRLLPPGRSH